MNVAAVILAAGAATRMGSVKQLLPYRGSTLLENAVNHAINAGFSPVIVVLGAKADEIQSQISGLSAEFVINPHWETGMGSSLNAGIAKLNETAPDCAGAAVLLADQPRITAHHLTQMLQIFQRGAMPIVASEYNGTAGVPAIFRKELFPTLASLPPEAGARHLLRNAGLRLHLYPLPEAATDVDTPEDFARLNLPT
jgi:molybdenum cofactor cytidylyltransferase